MKLLSLFLSLLLFNISFSYAQSSTNTITIAAGGDWDDHWGEDGATQKSLELASKHDLILMAGDLSYCGIDNQLEYNIQNAINWSKNANTIVKKTPILFVAGDHDSNNQDGDILTYAKHLKHPNGLNGVFPPTGTIKNHTYEGKYPYLWYSDVIKRNTKVRIVGTSSAFQETECEPTEMHKYLKYTYAKDNPNYQWVKAIYADAQQKGYWIIHLNHLPWIDMGKNQSFVDSQDLIDLAATYGVNVLITGSSHNIWRTKPLQINKNCPTIALTTKANGANPECVGSNDSKFYKKSDGLIQAHAGVAGKTKALKLTKYPDACDPFADGEVKHYASKNTCVTTAITGIVSLTITSNQLIGKFLKIDGTEFEPYTFTITK